MIYRRHLRRILFLTVTVLAGLLLWPVASSAVTDDERDTLRRMRAERRDASRLKHAGGDKSGQHGLFGLLVIPVDFADARLSADWTSTSLSPRLTAESGESLHQYFTAASLGQVDVRITLSPLIRLTKTRRDYSDRDLGGNATRSRAMATEALEAVRALGLEFRRLDMDGYDRVPGSPDDDGQVDGVLILHAAPGLENDPVDGLIEPLQFYLETPVVSEGIAASFYAVASMQSGPGIWAHETAHLMGLEDRYDPLLPTEGSEVRSRGGLGRYSLMSSGAWGTGDGWGAALPDGYSRLQMGWIPLPEPAPGKLTSRSLYPGETHRYWTRSAEGPEFFLVETRSPDIAAPFDANIPGADMLIYHVDETVPEGSWSDDGGGRYHLRVRLVEADDDRRLERGEDDGRYHDHFPGPLARAEFGPDTTPASDGYHGPTEVRLRDITVSDRGIEYTFTTSESNDLVLDYSFTRFADRHSGAETITFRASGREQGTPLTDLRLELVAVSSPAWGEFSGGQSSVAADLVNFGAGQWFLEDPVVWIPDPATPDGASTQFDLRFFGTDYDSGVMAWTWVWGEDDGVFDFENIWPGEWVIEHPDGEIGTTWHRWDAAPYLTADGAPVLACVDAAFPTSENWPQVTYGRNAHTTLTSGPLGDTIEAVRVTHALEVERLAANEVADGALVVWVDRAGNEELAVPLGGYPGRIGPNTNNARHGQPSFIDSSLELEGDIPLWRTDVIRSPRGPGGPWRLRFVFASNIPWRFRGWFIADIEAVEHTPESAFSIAWDGDLSWAWPFGEEADAFDVGAADGPAGTWRTIWSGTPSRNPATGYYRLDGATVLAGLPPGPRDRNRVRVVGRSSKGQVSGRPVIVFRDGGDGQRVLLAQPWPNPGTAPIRFQLDVPVARTAKVSIFDVRGRLVRRLDYPGGSHLGVWDGRDSRGQRAASGTYYLRLEGSGPVTTRKVVLLH